MKISVIIPVYNVGKYIKRCIDSVLKQTYKDIEVIVVNDGSTDKSGEICNSYIDSRVKVFHRKNRGLSNARNFGVSVATGNYIMFIDSDDWIDTDLIEKAAKCIEETNSDIVIYNYLTHFSEVGEAIDWLPEGTTKDQFCKKIWDGSTSPCIWRGVFNHTKWGGLGFLEEPCYEDIIIWPSILSWKNLKVSFIQGTYYHYERRNATSIMNTGTIFHYYFNYMGNLEKLRNNDSVFAEEQREKQIIIAYRLMVFNAIKSLMIHYSGKKYLSENQIKMLHKTILEYNNYANRLGFKYRVLLYLYLKCPSLFKLYSLKYNV